MRPNVSILVGSGFSIPEGLPNVKELSQRLSKIDESEIQIMEEQKANFCNRQEAICRAKRTDDVSWAYWGQRIFIQEFLEFYNNEILKGEEFNYETFYDFFSGYSFHRKNHENKETIEGFCKQFNDKHFEYLDKDIDTDCHVKISNFNISFSQLLASQLFREKYFEDKIIDGYKKYDPFIGFLIEILEVSDIKFHSLNHDLFFDWLAQHHKALSPHFTDGYQLEGSPFCGEVSRDRNPGTDDKTQKSDYIKLKHFVNKFDKSLALFKLHGSLLNKRVQTPDKQWKRFKSSYLVSGFYMETTGSKTGKQKREFLKEQLEPDFLSGTTNKIRYYTGNPIYPDDTYYKELFYHFEKNLFTSDLLVVIGYGFQDAGINEYLENNFLIRGKHMVVIDPKKPNSRLIEEYKATYIPKGVTELTPQEYLDLIPEELKTKK